jgi:hypothetical protein
MAGIHAAAAIVAAVATALVVVLALIAAPRGAGSRRGLDAAILLQLGAAGVTAVAGLGSAAIRLPGDPLHVLYGAVVVLAIPAGRYAGRAGPLRRTARLCLIGAVVAAGAVARSFMTGD